MLIVFYNNFTDRQTVGYTYMTKEQYAQFLRVESYCDYDHEIIPNKFSSEKIIFGSALSKVRANRVSDDPLT